jgi:tetratricopeptide (TPR) repeat protein
MIWNPKTGRLSHTFTGHDGRVTDVEFAPGGRQIASAGEDGTIKVWEIETGREVRSLNIHTNKVTRLSYSPDGRRIASSSLDGTIEVWEVPPDLAAPQRTAGFGPKRGAENSQDRIRRGMVRLQFGRFEDAERDFTTAIELGVDRNNPTPFVQRGIARAELGRWVEADPDFVRGIECRADVFYWFAHALVQLRLDEIEGYRKTCQQFLDQVEKIDEPSVTFQAANTCTLAPQAVMDLARPVRLAELLVARYNNQECLELLGLNLYRAGRFEEAIRRLEEAAQVSPDRRGSVWNWLFRAMAHHRLRHVDEAKKWLDQAAHWHDEESSKKPENPTRPLLNWNQRLGFNLLRREAEAMIKENWSLYLPANVFADEQALVRPAPH